MSEESPEVVNNTVMHGEAPASANTFLYSEKGANIQLTVRTGATVEEACRVLDVMVDLMRYGMEKYHLDVSKKASAAVIQPAAQPANQPTSSGPAPLPGAAPTVQSESSPLMFQAEELTMELKDGKKYFKVKGGPFRKHGVRIWDEVLEAAGYPVENLNEHSYDMAGHTAYYIEKPKDGRMIPDKVVRLVRNG